MSCMFVPSYVSLFKKACLHSHVCALPWWVTHKIERTAQLVAIAAWGGLRLNRSENKSQEWRGGDKGEGEPYPRAEGLEGAADCVFNGRRCVEVMAAGAPGEPEVFGGVDPVSPIGVVRRWFQYVGRVFKWY